MRTFHFLTLALVLSLAATPVFARGQARPGADHRYCQKHLQANAEKMRTDFQTLDADHDGRLTRQESGLKQAAYTCFNRLDRDHDHQLSSSELALN